MNTKFSVIDVETTGFGKSDRICEIGIVSVDSKTMDVTSRFETLINPERDIGPVHIHKITATDVLGAPIFSEVANDISDILSGSVLVAHNLAFDRKMVSQELDKLGAEFNLGDGLCTLRMCNESLASAAARYGIPTDHHRALGDAEASAILLTKMFEEDMLPETQCAHIKLPDGLPSKPPYKRGALLEQKALAGLITKMCTKTRFPTTETSMLEYLERMNLFLDDLILTKEEKYQLENLAKSFDLNDNDIQWAHEVYFQTLTASVKRDGFITHNEIHTLESVGDILDMYMDDISVSEAPPPPNKYPEGTRVCFTGVAVDHKGEKIERRILEFDAAKKGYQPVGTVTKKGCDLLVASDVASSSGKAKKARQYDIEIISVKDFIS